MIKALIKTMPITMMNNRTKKPINLDRVFNILDSIQFWSVSLLLSLILLYGWKSDFSKIRIEKNETRNHQKFFKILI